MPENYGPRVFDSNLLRRAIRVSRDNMYTADNDASTLGIASNSLDCNCSSCREEREKAANYIVWVPITTRGIFLTSSSKSRKVAQSRCGRYLLSSKESKFEVKDTKNKKLKNLSICEDCRQVFENSKLTRLGFRQRTLKRGVCPKCLKKYKKCYHCGNFSNFLEGKASNSDNHFYCGICYSEKFFSCSRCGKETLKEERVLVGGNFVCPNCFNNHTVICEECGDRFIRENIRRVGENYFCRGCAEQNSVIKRYDYIPRKWNILKNEWDNSLYLGIELEVETPDRERDSFDYYANKLSKFLKKNKLSKFFYMKHDGSVRGFELVSHPVTLQFIHKNLYLSKVLDWLRTNKFTSYKSGSCGFHIHMNKGFFTPFDLHRLRMFFYTNKEELKLFSKRNGYNLNYCRYEELDVKRHLKKCRSMFDGRQSNKYQAIRFYAPGKNTVEIRIFRGTLDTKRVIAILQFCDALAHYVKEVSILSIKSRKSWNDFLLWAQKTCRYCHFVDYIKDKSQLSLEETY